MARRSFAKTSVPEEEFFRRKKNYLVIKTSQFKNHNSILININ